MRTLKEAVKVTGLEELQKTLFLFLSLFFPHLPSTLSLPSFPLSPTIPSSAVVLGKLVRRTERECDKTCKKKKKGAPYEHLLGNITYVFNYSVCLSIYFLATINWWWTPSTVLWSCLMETGLPLLPSETLHSTVRLTSRILQHSIPHL